MEKLSHKKDFSRLFSQGKRVKAGNVRLWYLRKEEGSLRVAFVGKGKKAVDRNRVRRRLREAFRIYYYSQWKDKPVDFVFMSNEKLLEESFEDLVKVMGRTLEEVKLGGVRTESEVK
ncbi:MAG TPA: ribonuclease P protein component [Candidatus Atribacteria bacterium]|nr:ribonuclease P protein component [Candidatus Atribacteria bacterium]